MKVREREKTWTPRELAAERGITLRTVRNWLRGIQGVRLEHGMRTAQTYEISASQLERFLTRLADLAQRRRGKGVPKEFRQQRPVTKKHREQTQACLRSLGVKV